MQDAGVRGPFAELARVLAAGGCVAAEEEAHELLDAAHGDAVVLAELVDRRLSGEPLAWLTGRVEFAGLGLAVHHGVYVPRWQSEQLAERAASRLADDGTAVDLCTGSGALAAVLRHRRPGARVLATDIDAAAVACARANGVDAYLGDLFEPLPAGLHHGVDVVVAVVPYVPTVALQYLPRDTLEFEQPLSYDGGSDGADVLRRVVAASPPYLRPGAALLLETGGGQALALAEDLAHHGFALDAVLADDEGDERGIEATYAP